jgi:hypothetical protein
MKAWTASLFGVLACASPVLAQSGSGAVVDSIDWLKKNLGGIACVVFQMGAPGEALTPVTENTEVVFAGCNMTLQTATTIEPRSEVRTFQIPLQQLSSTAVAVIDGISIPAGWITAGDVPAFTVRLSAPPADRIQARLDSFAIDAPAAPYEYRTSEVNMLVRDRETADKLAAALSGAIALCHGR